MTLEEAKKIIELHNYHTAMRNQARKEDDKETEEYHQACLTNMVDTYDKASKLLIKHSSK